MSQYTTEELYRSIKTLDQKVDEGFRGIHSRQDGTNGKVEKNSMFRQRAIGALMVVSFLGVTSFVGLVLMWLKVFSME